MGTQSEILLSDVKLLVDDTENLVKIAASQVGEGITGIRNRAQEAANNLKPQLMKLETAAVDKAKAVATTTDVYVHENPWAAIGASAGIGLIIGLLIGRR